MSALEPPITSPEESKRWRPEIHGWSEDILPWYDKRAEELPDGARCVEIGVLHGRSIIRLAERLVALGKTHCELTGIDLWADRGNREACFQNLAHRTSGAARQLIHLVEGDSVESAMRFADGVLELVFIDANHTKPAVSRDVPAWMRKVKLGTGILSGHDYGAKEHPGVKEAVDLFLPTVFVDGSVWWTRRNWT
jgi:hypothetical protein